MNQRELKWLSSLQTKLRRHVADLIEEDVLFPGMRVYGLDQVSIMGDEITIIVDVEALNDEAISRVRSRHLLSEFVELGRTEEEVDEVEDEVKVNRAILMQMAREPETEEPEPEPELKPEPKLSLEQDSREQLSALLRDMDSREPEGRGNGAVKNLPAPSGREEMWAWLRDHIDE